MQLEKDLLDSEGFENLAAVGSLLSQLGDLVGFHHQRYSKKRLGFKAHYLYCIPHANYNRHDPDQKCRFQLKVTESILAT